MERFCLGVLLAGLGAFGLPMLPASYWPLVMLAGLMLLLEQPLLCGAACFLASLTLQYQQHRELTSQLLAQHSTEYAGTVVSIPRQYDAGSRFILQLSETVKGKPQLAAGALLQINWPEPPVIVKQGQRWQLQLKLKAIRGLANPGTGHREAQALVEGILAQGTVYSSASASAASAIMDADRQAVATYLGGTADWRQQVYDQLSRQLQHLEAGPLLIALTVGERPFTDSIWQGLQATGLGHLISISGMHIALLFGWLMLLAPLWQLVLARARLAKVLALLLALTGAWAYSLLSGFAIPTIRALLALGVVVLLQLALHKASGRQVCLLLTALLLLWQPLWLLSLSFWLTVSAVALVFYLQWRYPKQPSDAVGSRHWWQSQLWQFLRYQWLFCLLMLPVGLLFFQGIAPLALLSNLLFVPWCSLLAIPLLLMVFVLSQLSLQPLDYCWQLLDWLFWPLSWWLQHAATEGWWWSLPQQQSWLALAALAACLGLLLPKRQLALLIACWLLLPLWLQQLQPVPAKMHLIDVGQGTSVLLQQGKYGVLYDVGPRYGSFSVTQSQVLPYLRYAGIRQLDYLILSHDDSDHTGDPVLVKRHYPATQLVSDSPRFQPDLTCRQLPGQWQSFQIQQLWPPADGLARSKNDSSCVLLIRQGDFSLLLTGDIGTEVEKQLLQRHPRLRVHLLLLGHHGSQSSTALSWLQQLQPMLALNSRGFANPYRHPAIAVTAKLQLLQIPLLDTATLGALQLQFQPDLLQIDSFRRRRVVKWLENLPADAETADTTR